MSDISTTGTDLSIMVRWLVISLLCWFLTATLTVCDDCRTIKPTPLLGGLLRRSTIYVAGPTESLIDDQTLKERWYSSETYDMAQFAPEPGYCGAYNQVWMRGSIPKETDGIQPLISCQADAFGNCSKLLNNQIINCGTYRLYYLTPTDARFGYCFNPHGLKPGTVVNPKPAFRPTSAAVTYELTWNNLPRGVEPVLKFKCQFDTKPGDKTLQYIVYWYIDGVQLPLSSPVTEVDIDKSAITEKELTHLGVTLKCGVRVRQGDFGHPNDIVTSADFFAGIKIHTPTLTLQRGEVKQIMVEPTIPFGCPPAATRGLSCRGNEGMGLSMYEPGDSYNCDGRAKLAVVNSLTCGTYLDGISHKDFLDKKTDGWKKNYTFDVTTAKDTDLDMEKKLFSVYLSTQSFNDHKIWESYKLPSVQINVVDDNKKWKGKICYAHVDPHMKTFDGKSYESQAAGEYTMYKHKTYPMEIQYKTKSCNNNYAQCACAVSVRAGGDLFIIDKCGAQKLIDFVSCKDHILDVFAETESKYKITLPIGTIVQLTLHGGGYQDTMNIDIYSSVKDYDAIEGLCGSFSGDQSDDFMARGGGKSDRNTFTKSWDVPPGHSFLSVTNHDPPEWSKGAQLCVCHGNQTVCSGSESVTCKQDPNVKDVKCRLRKNSSTKRRKRWAYEYPEEDHQLKTEFKRAASIASFDDAKSECQKVFEKHPSYSLKDQLTENESLTESIRECALDVNMTGDMIWAAAHLDSWVDNSMELISKNNTFRRVSAVVAKVFAENACPRSCSGMGNCTNGTCICKDHFIAADCSIDSRTPPRTEGLYNDGLCDWQEEDCCDGFSVYGQPFVQTTTCTMKQTTIYTNGSRSTSAEVVVRAQFRSTYEVVCPVQCTQGATPRGPNGELPFVSTYGISISNDGRNFGQELIMTVYDSECQALVNDTKTISVALKDGFCFIDQACVRDGMQRSSDSCYYCDVGNHLFGWTRNTNCDKTPAPSGSGGGGRGYTVGPHRRSDGNSAHRITHWAIVIAFIVMVL